MRLKHAQMSMPVLCASVFRSTGCIYAGAAGLDREDAAERQQEAMSEATDQAGSDDLMLDDEAMPSGYLALALQCTLHVGGMLLCAPS